MRKLYYLSLVLFMLLGCNNTKNEMPVLDVQYAIDHPVDFDLGEYVSTIKYIPLETNKECLLGSISNVVFYGDKMYISLINSLYKFSSKGRFIKKIGGKGRGPAEFQFVCKLSINPIKNELCISDLNQLVRFDTLGNFIARDKINEVSRLTSIQVDAKGNYLLKHPNGPKQDVTVDVYDADLKPIKSIMNSITRNVGTSYNARMSQYDGKYFYNSPINDTIYSVDEDYNNRAEMVLNFGKYKSAPEDIDYFNKKLRNVYRSDVLYFGDNLKLMNLSSKHKYMGCMLYFNKLNKLIHPKHIKDSKYLGINMNGIEWQVKTCSNGDFILSIDALELLDNKDKIKDPKLMKLCETLTEESNPILAVVRIKK